MSINQETVKIDNHQIEAVSNYIYMGHKITLGKQNQSAEIKQRIALG